MILPSGFELRVADRSDAAMLRDVMLRCWTGTVAANSSAYTETDASIAREFDLGGAVLLLRGAEAVGAGRFHPVPGPAGDARAWAELKRVGVVKELRKLGLSVPLIARLENEVRSRGSAGVQIGVREDQPRLTHFWEGLGYQVSTDVKLHTTNPLTPPPVTLRKWF